MPSAQGQWFNPGDTKSWIPASVLLFHQGESSWDGKWGDEYG